MLSQFLRKSVDKLFSGYCAEREPADDCHQSCLSYHIGANRVTLFETPCGCPQQTHRVTRPVAQFRYHQDLTQWSLHYFSSRKTWVFYLNCGPSLDLAKILRHVDEDPLGMFWT